MSINVDNLLTKEVTFLLWFVWQLVCQAVSLWNILKNVWINIHDMFVNQVKSSQVAFNKNKWQSHEFYKHDEWK